MQHIIKEDIKTEAIGGESAKVLCWTFSWKFLILKQRNFQTFFWRSFTKTLQIHPNIVWKNVQYVSIVTSHAGLRHLRACGHFLRFWKVWRLVQRSLFPPTIVWTQDKTWQGDGNLSFRALRMDISTIGTHFHASCLFWYKEAACFSPFWTIFRSKRSVSRIFPPYIIFNGPYERKQLRFFPFKMQLSVTYFLRVFGIRF